MRFHPPVVHLVVGGLAVMFGIGVWSYRRRRLAVMRWAWLVYSVLSVMAVVAGSWDADAYLPYPRPLAFRAHEIWGYVYAWVVGTVNGVFWLIPDPRRQRRAAWMAGIVVLVVLMLTAAKGYQLVFSGT